MDWQHHARQVWVFIKYYWRRLGEDECFRNASTLAYTTLLSLVPLFAVFFAIFSTFAAFGTLENKIQDFVFQNFVPTSGELVQEYMQSFAQKAARMTLPGIVGLVVSAFLLMSTIDTALNKIWHTESQRNIRQRLVMYWAVMTMTPLLLGAGFAAWSYLLSLRLMEDTGMGLGASGLLKFAPVLFEWLGFVLLYVIVPNRRVVIKYALIGGAASTVLFEIAKVGFAAFITRMPGYEAIYGALAAVPIFLIWIYVSWVVILLGAIFTSSLENGDWRDLESTQPQIPMVPQDPMLFVNALRALVLFRQAHREGILLDSAAVVVNLESRQSSDPEWVLNALQQGGWIKPTEDDQWVLLKDLHEATVADVFVSYPYTLPMDEEHQYAGMKSLKHQLDIVREDVKRAMSVPLLDVLDTQEE